MSGRDGAMSGRDGAGAAGANGEAVGAPGAGRRGRLTRDGVVAAALRVADAEGLQRLTIRRVAAHLGVAPMALYTHVRDKDELLQAMADRVLADVFLDPLPARPISDGAPSGAPDWRQTLAQAARAYRQALARHPGAVPLFVAYASLGPAALRLQEEILARLTRDGFADALAVRAYYAVLAYATGFVSLEVPRARRPPQGVTGDAAGDATGRTPLRLAGGVPLEAEALAALPAAEFPHLVRLAPLLTAMTSAAQFEYGLQRLLDGIAGGSRREDD